VGHKAQRISTPHRARSPQWFFNGLLGQGDFLDPNDSTRTAEGLPAPTRAVLVARKP
jgi:tRNA (mo5U34)-methyltransferase